VSTPTTSPSGVTGSAAAAGDDGCGDDVTDELSEMFPMLYYDADEPSGDQQTHGYLTAGTCFNHGVSLYSAYRMLLTSFECNHSFDFPTHLEAFYTNINDTNSARRYSVISCRPM